MLNECGLEDVVNDYMSSNPIFTDTVSRVI